MIRFASIGDCCADIYKDNVVLGGTAYNVAIAAAKAGAKTSIISAIGNDTIGKQFLKSFAENKIDTSHLTIAPRTDTINISLDKYHRPVYSHWKTTAIETVHLSDKNFLNKHDIVRTVLFTSTQRLFEEFCALDLKSLKVGDFAGTSADSFDESIIEKYADNLDIAIKSEVEPESLKNLSKKYSCLFLGLLGKSGSIVFRQGKAFRQPAIKIQTKNTTGAGDVYQAYFLVNYLQTKNIAEAMRQATRAAARAIS